ncbi:hypothetical protein [Demequina sp. NBRC 110052]|uniref:hypothetical protein n=1 Tax=Demequina sp. NBRC 110052 TaxID=1570341 RepID=UPI0009FCBF60|nr:hypothetical protein [Demequina sp. NBRC 110052]
MTEATQRLVISDELVQSLVRDQFPDLADKEIGRHYALPDHTAVRIGDHHGLHLPTVPGLDEYYARSASLIAPFLDTWTFPLSAPRRTGTPGHGFPYHSELVNWINASTAGFVPLERSEAGPLGDALRQVHTSTDAPYANPTSSVPLEAKSDAVRAAIGRTIAAGGPESRTLRAEDAASLWADALAATDDHETTWTQGWIEPRTVLSDQGRFAGLLVWRYFAAGDPGSDLAGALALLPTDSHDDLLAAYGGVSPTARRRLRGHLLVTCLKWAADPDPFTQRLGWQRLLELGLVDEG